MAVIQRRVFQAKTGKANDVVALLHEEIASMGQAGFPILARILTDYLSGRTDRVVEEFTIESIGEFESQMAKAFANPAIAAQFRQMEQALFALIEYSEVEYWAIQATP